MKLTTNLKNTGIRLGPAGCGLGNLKGIEKVSDVGLNAMEVEFTYGVNMNREIASRMGELAKTLGVSLSVHAPYFINLASKEKIKQEASMQRILSSCERAHLLGAECVVFHPGFYAKQKPDVVYDMIRENMQTLMDLVKENRWKIRLCPETAGKLSVFGSMDEIMRLREDTGCHFCIDFAHLFARGQGKLDYDRVFEEIKGKGRIHSHFSGIEFTKAGEKCHKLTCEKELGKFTFAVIESKADITIINESPEPLNDALKTKEVFENQL